MPSGRPTDPRGRGLGPVLSMVRGSEDIPDVSGHRPLGNPAPLDRGPLQWSGGPNDSGRSRHTRPEARHGTCNCGEFRQH